jgi:hypothetical protein
MNNRLTIFRLSLFAYKLTIVYRIKMDLAGYNYIPTVNEKSIFSLPRPTFSIQTSKMYCFCQMLHFNIFTTSKVGYGAGYF